MDAQVSMTKFLLAFIAGLKAGGVKQVVISPGSRSTPLALLLHRDPEVECFLDVDERSAAFFALGLTKATAAPVALVCTSGSAAANYYPAVCEAEATGQPLVLLTTDRPAELQAVGAPQAMNQHDLYSGHVKTMVDLALPEDNPAMRTYANWRGWTSVAQALAAPAGPVQVNLPLREPLLPDLTLPIPPVTPHRVLATSPTLAPAALTPWLGKRGLLVVGEERTPAEAAALAELAALLGWPLVGDPLANLAGDHYLPQADLLCQGAVPTPEVIIRFGRLPVTKPLSQWLAKQTAPVLLVEDGPRFHDQHQRAAAQVSLSPAAFLAAVQAAQPAPAPASWLATWRQAAQRVARLIAASFATPVLDHSLVGRKLPEWLHDQDLFWASSNAIRLVDRLAERRGNGVRVFGNRGVNGIDGLLSTAAGICAASDRPLTLLIGDLAFFHDLNGLAMVKRYRLPLTVVLLNNDGGGIFSFLAQRKLPAADFDPLFATPQGLDFQAAAAVYGLPYHRPADPAAFRALLNQPGARLIEVGDSQAGPVDRWHRLQAALKGANQ